MALEVQRNVQLRNQIAQVEFRLVQLERHNQKLSEELQLAADPRYREGLIRQMGYVHKDELLFVAINERKQTNKAQASKFRIHLTFFLTAWIDRLMKTLSYRGIH